MLTSSNQKGIYIWIMKIILETRARCRALCFNWFL